VPDRNHRETYARRNLRAREEYGLTGYAQLRSLGGRTGLERDFPLSARSRELIRERAVREGTSERSAVQRAHTEYISARIKLARREAGEGRATPLQERIARSFSRRQTVQEINEYGQPAAPPPASGGVSDLYDWYDEWWGDDDPWDELEDHETP
jgi:hypothetical protein